MQPGVKVCIDKVIKTQRQKSIDLVNLRLNVAELANVLPTVMCIDHHLELILSRNVRQLPIPVFFVFNFEFLGPLFEFVSNDYFILIF